MTLPERLQLGQTRQFDLDTYKHYRDKHRADPQSYTRLHDTDFRWLMGYRVPTWQRDLGAWSQEQMAAFCSNLWLGIPPGHILINEVPETVMRDDKAGFHRLDHILLDGQHRLHSLDLFFDDEFPIFGKHWSEFEEREQIHFLRVQMPAHELAISDENTLKHIYDAINFSGVAHTEDQRASDDYEPVRSLRP